MRNRSIAVAASVLLIAALFITGCGSKENNLSVEEPTIESTVESTEGILEISADDFCTGISDMTVFEGSQVFAYISRVSVDRNVVKDVIIDISDVNVDHKGDYEIRYYLIFDTEAVKAALSDSSYQVYFGELAAQMGETPEVASDETVVELQKTVHIVARPEEESSEEESSSVEESTEEDSESETEQEETSAEEVPEQPAEPVVVPTQPAPQPTQPVVVPTQPAPQPTQPVVPTQPAPQPTQPAPQPTQPAPQPTLPIHTHDWKEQFQVVHFDAVTHVVHHEAVTEVVHHEAVTHIEVIPATESWHTITVTVCSNCHQVLSGSLEEHKADQPDCEEADYIQETQEERMEESAYEVEVVDSPARDETVTVKEAWDEIVVDREARDETVSTGFVCACGARK